MSQERAPEWDTETRTIQLAGYPVTVQPPTPLQLAMVLRVLKRVDGKENATGQEILDAVSKACAVLESMIIDEGERSLVVELVLERKVDLQALASIIQVFQDSGETRKPAPRKRAVRARTK